MKSITANRTSLIFLLVFIAAISGWILLRTYTVKENGIYTIAEKTGISQGGKNGASSIYTYNYKSKPYTLYIIDYGKGNNRILVQFLADRPNSAIKVSNENLSCIDELEIPKNGWKSMPKCR